MNRDDASAPGGEAVQLTRHATLPGVEALRARFVGQRFSRHVHEEYALGVLEGGGLRFAYRGRDWLATAGQVNTVVPGEPHDGRAAVDEGWRYRMFYLAPDLLRDAREQLDGGTRPPHFPGGVVDDPLLADLTRRAHLAWETAGATALARRSLLLEALARWLSRHGEGRVAAAFPEGGEGQDRSMDRSMDRIMELLRVRFAEDLSLEDLAREAGMSPFHLLRRFKRRHGLPPHAWLVELRLREARRLLAGDMRLADIAAAVGFSDQSHFTRLCKARHGLTPGRLRNFLQYAAA